MELKEKLKAYSEVSHNGCWEWQRYRMPCGYGRIRHGGRMELTHRLSYLAFNGDIPDGLVVRHKCDNKCCVNPEHLTLGTQKDNVKDAIDRGQFVYRENPKGAKHHMAKLNEKQVMEVYNSTQTQSSLAETYGVSRQLISAIKRGKLWQHVTQHVELNE